MEAKALRNIEKLGGKRYKAGDAIPEAVIASMTPQVLASLVQSHTIEVPGMDAKVGSAGASSHAMARIEQQGEKIKKLEAGRVEDAKNMSALVKRMEALEGKKPVKAAPAPKAVGTKAQ